MLITVDSDRETINIYDARTLQRIRVIDLPGDPVRAGFTSMDNHISVCLEIDERYWNMIWNIDGKRLNLGESEDSLYDAYVSPRGDKIAVQYGANEPVKILNAADLSCSAILDYRGPQFESLIWNDQQDTIAIVDKMLHLYNACTGAYINATSTFESPDYAIKFDKTGKHISYCALLA